MTRLERPHPVPGDPAIPAAVALTGDEAPEMLSAALDALRGTSGGTLEAVRLAQVSWRPGRTLTAQYHIRVANESGDVVDDTVVATTGGRRPPGALVLQGEAGEVAAWRLLDDPWLPGLRTALDPGGVRDLLAGLGVPAAPVQLELRAYRPGRRAVVEVWTAGQRFFVKVVQPHDIAHLQSLHCDLEPVLPVPLSHGWSEALGLIVLRAMPGETLREVLADEGGVVPEPADLAVLLDRIPWLPGSTVATAGPQAARSHARLLRHLAPDLGADLQRLQCALRDDPPAQALRTLRPVHGDFHGSQLLVQDGAISALLDVDTVALGDHADDWASLIAQIDLQDLDAPDATPGRIGAYRDRLIEQALRDVDAQRLHLHIAAAVLGFATGPFRVQSPHWPGETRARIARALAWLDGVPARPTAAAATHS